MKKSLKRSLARFMIVPTLIALPSCSLGQSHRPIAISYLLDQSASAQNDEQFQKDRKRVCQAIAKGLVPGDEFGVIFVTGESALFQNLQRANPALVRKECQQQPVKQKPGTLVCPAVAGAKKQFESTKIRLPILVLQVQVNEKEAPCQEIMRDTAQLVIKRGGSVLVLNSTNEGGESFRAELEAALEGLPILYSQTQPEIAVKETIEETRNKGDRNATK
ncbi:MAG: hypothetical protein IM504_13210 [Microcystis sp. M038S2]|jgi:hypothetical protein|uniref:VWA domain-containing protein n=1 Tax=Microcystis aeruginosa G11-04 TaxID=2685956 RepID=A0A966G1R1_MICAE|nr:MULTISPECIES: hypothetical protein [unclassified Microcystis]NCR12117.1 hypothetical protein [Microcystis aeruginosa SX13-11]NCR16317.1 hypothetical protein [Microcystis aeruginosa LL13-03]NCR25564.1 hypothetical protein [Microcystis aeruginosa LE13-04]NCR42925.1 hypothetical protein [Microcystis aeruginosa SX13-01]NCS10591.1 hypothetical protein [Microcystis aeruginosa G13-09]NCS14151.1 hypothetical protein [Microcystis aeruginosa G13-12]NCS18640.1 hypothetical protein [Microcystis aerug